MVYDIQKDEEAYRKTCRKTSYKKNMIYKKSSSQAKFFTGPFSDFVPASVAVNVLVTETVVGWK